MAKFQDLDPKKQAALFAAMQNLGGLSVDTGESQDTQDPQAQAGITAQTNANPVAAQAQKNIADQDNSTDYSQIQNLWRDAQNPTSQVSMQPGDKMHPADAIAQVVQNMQQGSGQGAPPTQNAPGQTAPPTAPGQTPQPVQGPVNGPTPTPDIANNARIGRGGASAIPNAPANSWIGRLTGQTIPGYSAQIPAKGLIPRLLGMQASAPLGASNYYDTLKQMGLEKYIPSGQPTLPDGTPFVSKDVFDQTKLAGVYGLQKDKNQVVTTGSELAANGVKDPADQAAMLAAYPNGVPQFVLANWNKAQGTAEHKEIGDALLLRAKTQEAMAAYQLTGAKGLQDVATKANTNLSAVSRVEQLIQQIQDNGNKATARQRSELGLQTAVILSNSAGVATDDKMNQFVPPSYAAKGMNFVSAVANEDVPMDFSGFLPQFKDLISREKIVNQGLSQAGTAQGMSIMNSLDPQLAYSIAKNRSTNAFIGNPPANPGRSASNPTQSPLVTGYLQKYNAKDTPANRDYAARQLGLK